MLTLQVVSEQLGLGSTSVDVTATTTLGELKGRMASALGLQDDMFVMRFASDDLESLGLNEPVSRTALVEGDEVVLRPSEKFKAGQQLEAKGLTASWCDIRRLLSSSGTPCGEKAETVQLMLTYDKNIIHAKGGFAQMPALSEAAKCGATGVAKVLINGGAEVDGRDTYDSTALMRAAEAGQSKAVSALLDMGANPNFQRHDGATPLHKAACKGYSDIARLLLAHSARITPDAKGVTALHWASARGYTNTAEVLLLHDKGAADMKDSKGMTPLDYARQMERTAVVDLLERSTQRCKRRKTDSL